MFIIDRFVCSSLYRIWCHFIFRDYKQKYLSKTNTITSFGLFNLKDLEMTLETIRTMKNKHFNVTRKTAILEPYQAVNKGRQKNAQSEQFNIVWP